ncbi:hypothetical protein [Poseidonibacter ostreae]|jgi:hypothetical protein|uniref:Uncharacterized protein n=1 Tax=Poseidonibacter ostreae TaxID=2654171 RepID=A0A6L4WSD8_9BACT|nr:hypothetical protein [Poseidonibacter ostreae]KAB7887117.1 hypothetical protein GA417_03570 [Poseidonibacter ostreae]KAB7888623.1 hypothetical protein GBG19_08410 [Poseidonibacter ostreae]KAB7892330.1 hypothetical protein GBG18_03510 [Poseidonibacter ostreae]MAC82787.1 hypothetical protein [Arcobacter sp.]|tara:strand:- start:128 stop:322 length:195 start_codon:yes stop_codon:yes gene_type:complete
MEELIVSKEELIQMFETEELKDSGKGWIMNDEEIDIIALHDVDPKFLQDITNAKFYKLTSKGIK